MDSVGSFELKEVDGERSFVYVPAMYSNEPAVDSGETDGLLSQTRFLCPYARSCLKQETDDGWAELAQIDSYDGVTPLIEPLDNYERLDLFNRHVVLPLFWCNNEYERSFERCGVCSCVSKESAYFYYCVTCDKKYHKECIESPPKIHHPLHPKHPLQLSFTRNSSLYCFRCKNPTRAIVHQCTLCKFKMHPICAAEPVSYVIEQCKRHDHPLTFFTRKQASLDCNVCGLINDVLPTYVCLPCNFVAHSECVDSPHVIRISRHHHRVSFTFSLPPGNKPCGVCRKEVSREYGGYTCTKECEDYVVHSRCALRKDIWDGEELAGVPEEEEEVVEPFERISEGVILHFSHKQHVMRLETSRVYDESKICDACVIPIYDGDDFYSCGECDFILHDKCANAPRRKRHPLHPHPLKLKVIKKNGRQGYEKCVACGCEGTGFNYECMKKECWFCLDLRCASISEPYDYQGHEHPLFLALDPAGERKCCQVCQNSYRSLLNCIECDYIICFECVTLPYMARYKHDKHFLTYSFGDETSKPDWCEVCEEKLFSSYQKEWLNELNRPKRWFYTCKDCCTSVHMKCLLGEDRYFKPGHIVSLDGSTKTAAKILLNNSLSRPTCHSCNSRCKDKIIFRLHNQTWCCLKHFTHYLHDTIMSYSF